jgi:hypothetical protein
MGLGRIHRSLSQDVQQNLAVVFVEVDGRPVDEIDAREPWLLVQAHFSHVAQIQESRSDLDPFTHRVVPFVPLVANVANDIVRLAPQHGRGDETGPRDNLMSVLDQMINEGDEGARGCGSADILSLQQIPIPIA